jgi:ATP-dependent DNA helicase RecQ
LRERGIRACAYHGGMSAKRRNQVQEDFMAERDCDVIVATVAFGMGIDKANVRWIFHEQVSDSIDSYYQEVGRAGRDGNPARAELFYRPEDLGLRRFFAAGGVDREEIEHVAAVGRARRPVDPVELAQRTSLSRTKLAAALHRLEEAGAVELTHDGAVTAAAPPTAIEQAVEEAASAEADRQAFDRSRIEMMRAYAERTGCRRAFLLGYLGEHYDPPCGNCDNCERGHGEQADARTSSFATGIRVRHDEWGEGTVGSVEDGQLTVVFDSVGYKTLAEDLVADRNLLTPADES